MLAPNVVRTIKVLRSSRVKDLMAASGPLHITHAIMFTRTVNGLYMKLCTFPQGPTITFSIQNYSLQRDVLASQKRAPSVPPSYELTAPCLMMNSLQPHAGPSHLQLVASSMLQIFPKIVPNETSCRFIRRCCLLNYDEKTEELDLRHYVVRLTNTASARLVTKLVNSKHIPDLHNFREVEDALAGGAASESEGEEDSKVELKHQVEGSSQSRTSKSSIKMKDAGPRITMKVHKVQTGLLGGEVLYNRVKKLSAKEKKQLKELREIKKKEKLARKQRQAADIARKQKKLEDHKDKCLGGMPEELKERAIENKKKRKEGEEAELSEREDEVEEEKEDVDYYREEVGELPEGVSFSDRMKRRREKDTDALEAKKKKVDEVENKQLEAKLSKAKERYKKLDERRKKRPRAYGKRLVKQMKQKVKQRQVQKNANKDQEEDGHKAAPKAGPKTAPKAGSKAGASKK